MSHPDPDGPADLTPIEVGEVWTNPVTGDRATFLELPSMNPDGRCSSELTVLVGGPGGEHRHPTVVERFTVLEGELTVMVDGQTSVLGKGETATVDAGVWHESWNAGDSRRPDPGGAHTGRARASTCSRPCGGSPGSDTRTTRECRIDCSWR